VGSISNTTSGDYLDDHHIFYKAFDTPSKGLAALENGEIDAFVYDKPILRYLVSREYQGILNVLPRSFFEQNYAIALPQGSKLREPLNRALLRATTDPKWRHTLQQYLGQ
jgi:ABC-type amino acid transport substrate-binding protein